jgi:protein involved in polysaccharide export with SLBB domain
MACAAGFGAARPAPLAPDVPAVADGRRVQRLIQERGTSSSEANYRIGEGDELAVNVLGVQDLAGRYRVSELGRIALPLVRPIAVEGLTVKEATAALRRALEQYLEDPVVTVSVAERKGAQVAVMGAVGSPGSYSLEGFDETLADLITRAGGIGRQAGPTLYLFPSGAGHATPLVASVKPAGAIAAAPIPAGNRVEIDLTRLYRGSSVPELSVPLRAGDVILIPLAGEVFINGWVEHPGNYPLQTRMTLTDALARAGGLHFGASRGDMTLVRVGAGGKPTVRSVSYSEALSNTSLDPYLQAGDRIEVAANPVRAAGWGLYWAMRSVIGFQAGGRVFNEELNSDDGGGGSAFTDGREFGTR